MHWYLTRIRNSCNAAAIGRFPVDLYHMNDFHGAVAPLHLLPRVIPCCLSLHDAEIQGSWPIRTAQEIDELRRVYNLKLEVIRQYVQFGEFFNLLHAGATYLGMAKRVWCCRGLDQTTFSAIVRPTSYFLGTEKDHPSPTKLTTQWDLYMSGYSTWLFRSWVVRPIPWATHRARKSS